MSDQPKRSAIRYFGDYILLGEIARGGMGVVYHAVQASLDREVAIKMIDAGNLAGEAASRRFQTEAEAMAQLDHPNIVSIYEVGEHEGQRYLAMKLIEGNSLAEQIAEGRWKIGANNRKERQQAIARLMATVAEAVHHAHQRGVLHRDIKPGNILLNEEGEPHVTDFGLAKLTKNDAGLSQNGAVLGTPSYMAPEQAAGKTKQITTATDVYALGVVLYELLTGERPFHADDVIEILKMVVQQEPRRPRSHNPLLDRDLETICLKCLEKSSKNRYHTAEELTNDLERWIEGKPILARPVGSTERLMKWVKRHPIVAGLSASLATSIVLGLVVTSWLWRVAVSERDRTAHANISLQLQRAEDLFAFGKAQSAIATLGRVLRENPGNRAAQERLVNALNSRGFLVEVSDTVTNRPPPISTAEMELGRRAARTPEGILSATATNQDFGRIELWSATGAAQPTIDSGHSAVIRSIRFGSNGTLLVSASADKTACVWNINLRRVVATLKHPAAVQYAEFHPSGKWVITAASDGIARLWDVGSSKILVELPPQASALSTAVFSPDGSTIATGAEDRTVRLWQLTRGALIPIVEPLALRGAVWSIAFGTSTLLATLDDGTQHTLIWTHISKRATKEAVSSQPQIPRLGAGLRAPPELVERVEQSGLTNILCSDVSPDGSLLAVGSEVGTAMVWDVQQSRPITPRLEHAVMVNSISFSPDGLRIATSTPAGMARVWLAGTGEPLTDWLPFTRPLTRVAFSSDGSSLESPNGEFYEIHLTRFHAPRWLAELAAVIAGEEARDSPSDLRQLRSKLLDEGEAGEWTPWVTRLFDGS